MSSDTHTMTTLLRKSIIWLLLVVSMGRLVSSTAQEKMTNKHFTIAAIPKPPFLMIKSLPGGQKILSGQLGDAINFWHHAREHTYMKSAVGGQGGPQKVDKVTEVA